MKTKHQGLIILMAVFIIVAASGCRTTPGCDFYGEPHFFSAAEMAGSWIGFEASDTDLFRLYLDTNSTGFLTCAYSTVPQVETYRSEIVQWNISTNNLLFCSFRQETITDNFDLSCRVLGGSMEGELRNGAKGVDGAKVKIVFQREKNLDEKLKALRQ